MKDIKNVLKVANDKQPAPKPGDKKDEDKDTKKPTKRNAMSFIKSMRKAGDKDDA